MNNLSKGLVIALAAVAMLSGLMIAAVSIPNAQAADSSPPSTPPNDNALRGCFRIAPPLGSVENGIPFCPQ